MEWNHFMKILLLDHYFKIKSWVYRGILRVLIKRFTKSNFIPSHSSQFQREWKTVPSYLFHLGVCAVWSTQFFFKFVTKPIGIGFIIIKTDAHRLGLIFWPIAMRFDQFSLIGLVGLIWYINNLFFLFFFFKSVQPIKKSIQRKLYKKNMFTQTVMIQNLCKKYIHIKN